MCNHNFEDDFLKDISHLLDVADSPKKGFSQSDTALYTHTHSHTDERKCECVCI